jgi:hypothetical protein
VFDAMQLYRSHPLASAPQADQNAFYAAMKEFQSAHCYNVTPFTSEQEYDPENPDSLTPVGQTSAWVQYMGVWDTVGSLGIPDRLPFAPQIDAKYKFYDTNLSWFIRSARHAVSIDEQRATFAPALMANIADLNGNAHATELVYDKRPYQQQWFPGGHGSVGGGQPDGGLSLVPMLWVAEGATRAGLAFDAGELNAYQAGAHPDAKFQVDSFGFDTLAMEAMGMSPRAGPGTLDETSLSARLRWHRLASYRPVPLKRANGLQLALENWTPSPDPQVYYCP